MDEVKKENSSSNLEEQKPRSANTDDSQTSNIGSIALVASNISIDSSKTEVVNRDPPIGNCPREVIYIIFEMLLHKHDTYQELDGPDRCTSTCLALTCREYWGIFQSFQPGIIDLKCNWTTYIDHTFTQPTHLHDFDLIQSLPSPQLIRCSLHELLRSWVGPQYRPTLCLPESPFYLSRKDYGDSPGTFEEYESTRKWADYKRIKDRDNLQILPSPFGRGDAWYPEAVEALEMLVDFVDQRDISDGEMTQALSFWKKGLPSPVWGQGSFENRSHHPEPDVRGVIKAPVALSGQIWDILKGRGRGWGLVDVMMAGHEKARHVACGTISH